MKFFSYTFDSGESISIPISNPDNVVGNKFDEDSWDIWVNLSGKELVSLYKEVSDTSVRNLIVIELEFRDQDDVQGYKTLDKNSPRDFQWKEALEAIKSI